MEHDTDVMETIRGLITELLIKAGEIAQEGEVHMMFFLIKDLTEEPLKVLAVPPPHTPDKDMIAVFMDTLIKTSGAKAYLFVTEAWEAAGDAAEEAIKQNVSLRDFEGEKSEAIFCTYEGPGGPLMARRSIGENREVGEVEFIASETSGRFCNLGGVCCKDEENQEEWN